MKEVENYSAISMPLSNDPEFRAIQEKVLAGLPLSLKEKMMLGRDHPVKVLDGYPLKPDCVYRAVSVELYQQYLEAGFVYGLNPDDEYAEYVEEGKLFNNNKGVDWYLGGVSLRYGNVVIECPASKEYFVSAHDNGCHLSADPTVRHMKSSGYQHPVPMNMVRLIHHPNKTVDFHERDIVSKHR